MDAYIEKALVDANIKSCPKDPEKKDLEYLYRAFYTGKYEGKDE